MSTTKNYPIYTITKPLQRFIQQEKSGGIVLGINVVLALIIANSPWAGHYFDILKYHFGLYFNGSALIDLSLLHWINDGLMAIFFFVVGLELKREFVGGELSQPRKAMLPIFAALGGMIVPAAVYLFFNPSGEVHSGWGIPMATDIAFALGVLYLLGNRVPMALKVFLTALAIVDDLGAVMVIALFYTSDISMMSLVIGLVLAGIMYIGNRMGVRSILFYGIIGIGGVWTAFLLSGVHATIAAVIAAFMIPADVQIKEQTFIKSIQKQLRLFMNLDPKDEIPTLTEEQVHVLSEIKEETKRAMPPLQRLEHKMHPYVTFVILPIFALANAGVSLAINPEELFSTNVALGVAMGLLVGKVVGIVGFTMLLIKLKVAVFPEGMNVKNLFGLSLLAAIGFTMSLFITSLAFTHEEYMTQAKIGIFAASIIGGVLGYLLLKQSGKEVTTTAKE
ncbi:MAG TPA: Na+/H+ antiporter NhaA [Moheibacter sp.]|nr:Na+/H+ antiporter NhaA [Moheibacter sp.]